VLASHVDMREATGKPNLANELREVRAAVAELIAAVKNKRNADCGLPKDCGHTFDCTCPGMRLDAAVAACERAS
jgi:hypothetical protein